MAKEITFKGKTLKELQELSLEEFAKLVTSRQRRSLKRGVNKKLMKKIDKALEVKKQGKEPKPVRTHRRDVVIVPKMIGLRFGVYNGKSFEPVVVQLEMLGHMLGEFSMTRKRLQHGKAGIGATKSSTAITARG